VQGAQFFERVRGLDELHVGALLPPGEARGEEADEEEGDVVQPDVRQQFARRHRAEVARAAGEAERAREHQRCVTDGAADRRDERAARAEQDARRRDDNDVERDVRRVDVAARADEPRDDEHVAENLGGGLETQRERGEREGEGRDGGERDERGGGEGRAARVGQERAGERAARGQDADEQEREADGRAPRDEPPQLAPRPLSRLRCELLGGHFAPSLAQGIADCGLRMRDPEDLAAPSLQHSTIRNPRSAIV